ncbi:hypothetical protein BH24CHL1_BH24CHL1_05700 [soil metagenome]
MWVTTLAVEATRGSIRIYRLATDTGPRFQAGTGWYPEFRGTRNPYAPIQAEMLGYHYRRQAPIPYTGYRNPESDSGVVRDDSGRRFTPRERARCTFFQKHLPHETRACEAPCIIFREPYNTGGVVPADALA